jgi:thioredoxin 1/putative thioredoxin
MTILGGPSGFGSRGGDGKGADIPVITERDFEQQVLRSEVPVLVEFSSARTAQKTTSELAAFMSETAGKVAVFRVEAERSPMLVRQLRIQQLPTFMLFAEQRVADAQVGPLRKKDLLAMVEPFLPRPAGALRAAELAVLIAKGLVTAIDTRDAAAYTRAHLPKSVNMPLEELAGRIAELYMVQGQPVLYCRSGDKTKEVTARMASEGVELGYLEGGLLAWEAEALPIERT